VCGIVAITGDLTHRADAIVADLGHRGPDSTGSVAVATCTLAMARLAIMDPDPRSNQPMGFAGTTLVYNGEIYNFMSLRGRLEQLGHQFATTGDTEVLLHAAVEWGVEHACERLEGMFAFALWDDRTRSLHLARDCFGIKPLYWLGDGRGVAAASEVTPLAAAFGLRPRLNAIREFLRFGSPVTDPSYEGAAELEPGSILTWRDRTIRVRSFARRLTHSPHPAPHRAPDPAPDPAPPPAEAVRTAVARQLRSDRPMVVFLSGGFDSALLAAAATHAGTSLTALTLSTRDNSEEVRRATETARSYGLPHEIATVDDDDLVRTAEAFLDAMDQPTVDGFNTFLIARAAIDRGFPVALSGLGGDETLGGYGYSRRLRQVDQIRRVWNCLPAGTRPHFAAGLAPLLHQHAPRLEAILAARSVAATWTAWRCLFDDDEIRTLTGGAPDPSPRWFTDRDDPTRTQLRHLDFAVYLRATLLRDCDVFSMANSVEVRVPLLDREFVSATDDAALTKKGLARLMGDDLLSKRARQRKLAFVLPWQRWLALLEPSLDDLMAPGEPFADVVDVAQARRILAADGRSDQQRALRRWALLVLARWLTRDAGARRTAPRRT
jgi:asparagine synthase (glutamine-hydrolysing)